MRRVRPIFFLVMLLLATGGYFASTSTWADLMKIKGPAWFGVETDAPIVDAAGFTEMSWTAGGGDTSLRDHVRVKYELDVDGRKYHYPWEQGYVEVAPEVARQATVRVTYLPEDPSRNYPLTKDFDYADPMTGFVVGVLLLLTAAVMLVVWVLGLVRGRPEPAPAPA